MASPLDISVQQAREVVRKVSSKNGWIEPEEEAATPLGVLEALSNVREELATLVEVISEDIGSGRGRFILELTQNVEDCSFDVTNDPPWLNFDLSPERIVVESNQDGFNERDVRYVCRTGDSWKRQAHGYVGNKGIGFKAVFQVASRVDIQSNAFSFHFIYNRQGTVEDRLGMVTPLQGNTPIPEQERPLTRMTLTTNVSNYDNILRYFDEIDSTLLLFLQKIQTISIRVHQQAGGCRTTTFSQRVPYENVSAQWTTLIKTVGTEDAASSELSETSHYYVFKSTLTGLSAEHTRPERDGCELVLAFRVDDNDQPLLPTRYDVFAYLPVGNFGFNFLIQADFILQASREEIMSDSQWNRDILSSIVDSFSEAMLDFCRRYGPLRYNWVKYLPFGGVLESHYFWRELPGKVLDRLKDEYILYLHGTNELRKPQDVRTFPPQGYVDDNGSPLFRDRPGRHSKYLSLEYGALNIQILKRIFGIADIEDLAMCHRIREDLRRPDSTMKNPSTPGAWHRQAARLIMSILRRSQGTAIETYIMEELQLIPLSDGRWVAPRQTHVYFPAEIGPGIPQDIVVTIDAGLDNEVREELFQALGAVECPPEEVIDKIFLTYSTGRGVRTLESSKAHLSYLFWHVENISDPRFRHLQIYDHDGIMAQPHRIGMPVYLPTEDEYGPQMLLRRVPPILPIAFLHPDYLRPMSPINRQTGRYDMSWLKWVVIALRIRDVPRLASHAGTLSAEFRHILQRRQDKIIGTLKTHWGVYRREMRDSLIYDIKTANVSCWGIRPKQMDSTYFPTEQLENQCRDLGITLSFPFLDRTTLPGYDGSAEDWAFLARFGVQFEPYLNFYLEILRQHASRPQSNWDSARGNILKTYSAISDHGSEIHTELIVEAFYRENLILDPACLQPDSNAPRWIDIDDCVWKGPEDLLDKTPLYSASEYRNSPQINRLFHQRILKIKDADWKDYQRTLIKIKTNPEPSWDATDRAQRLYTLLAETRLNDETWSAIRHTFEEEKLVYLPSADQWYPPSQCLWSSPLPIPDMVVIGSEYPDTLKDFFLMRLKISPASLPTLIEALVARSRNGSSLADIKQTIKAINRMKPTWKDLQVLRAYGFLPIRRHSEDGNVTLGNLFETFAVIDNTKISAIFNDHVDMLDFSLEEVLELEPFLHGLGLKSKYLSRIYTTDTDCGEGSTMDDKLTDNFMDIAYDILRIVVTHRRIDDPQPLYFQLQMSSVLKSNAIRATYTLRHENGDTTGPIPGIPGHVHVEEVQGFWAIFVPEIASEREISYKLHLPRALARLLDLPASCRDVIGLVLNSSPAVIDELLETEGIGQVLGIEPPVRRLNDDENTLSDEEQATDTTSTPQGTSRPISRGSDDVPRASRAIMVATERRSAPISREESHRQPLDLEQAVDSEQEPYPQSPSELESESNLDNVIHLPIRQVPNVDAYTQLLGHVIRIARETDFPRSDSPAAPGNGRYLPGYDALGAFGVRSLNQIGHDKKIGAAGELFVYEMLLGVLRPHFGEDNWRSTIRRFVTVHPNYRDMLPWNGQERSDIVYQDTDGRLTLLLVALGYLDIIWEGTEPEYLIEVKTTTGNCADRFFMSTNQYNMMQTDALQPGQTSDRVYLICRVYDLGKDSMNLKIYVDPEAHRQRDALLFAENGYTVTPRSQA
ncbi:ATPase of HSP90 chaperone/DNA topoisomerase II/histidine kinase [Glarea lozoyensis ATCC 20868]|uniref:ATPase of HSP90 chaperone/DNA topoisomerase II/histidine kinase n=1 Tax=Glarea lozoyensis (strain ATCC 20868 / MF5171) TaxID=1116229 RepID=S3D6T9_GLAL2|nr:ATPase of HSP90 chaperone/DNA topoisomerase II/histidine kinase [Glarea lozoyensis ATCC 20868]EPE32824.1 ATPase of HSP90 chaperone/DNA topoisomerase II/histidine kinase [Glarea lozoyensis ATCC 20868]